MPKEHHQGGFDFKRQQYKCGAMMAFNRKKCEHLKNIKAQYKDPPHITDILVQKLIAH